jgi:hypothetical protein
MLTHKVRRFETFQVVCRMMGCTTAVMQRVFYGLHDLNSHWFIAYQSTAFRLFLVAVEKRMLKFSRHKAENGYWHPLQIRSPRPE